MSKFFFKGRPDVMGSYGKSGYAPKPKVKLGTEANPLSLVVKTDERQLEVKALLTKHGFIGTIEVNPEIDENLNDLETALNKPKTQRFDKVPERNAPCSCGSGKKYKKCCG